MFVVVGWTPDAHTCAAYPKHGWSYEVVRDETTDERRLTCLTMLDEYTRAGLTTHGACSMTAENGGQVLQRFCARRGAPG